MNQPSDILWIWRVRFIAKSGDVINYTIRTKKSVERKIFLEILRKLANFDNLSSYQYIGMGSKYFVDFNLFHRELGIEEMISIEGDSEREERYRFNIPYNCIRFQPGYTYEILPNIDYSKKSIIWLDYDGGFNASVISDIETVFTNLISGSLFLFSVNTNFNKTEEVVKSCHHDDSCQMVMEKGSRLDWCKNEFGERLPEYNYDTGEKTTEKNLTPKNATKIIRKMSINEIDKVLSARNALTDIDEEKYVFKQLISIMYNDNAPMYSFGGLVIKGIDDSKYEECDFERNKHIVNNDSHIEIKVPELTFKEVNLLNSLVHLPEEQINEELEKHKINRSEFDQFKNIYRYFPQFSEVNIG